MLDLELTLSGLLLDLELVNRELERLGLLFGLDGEALLLLRVLELVDRALELCLLRVLELVDRALELCLLRVLVWAMCCCSPSRVNLKGLELALGEASLLASWTAMAGTDGMAAVVARIRARARRGAIHRTRVWEFISKGVVEQGKMSPLDGHVKHIHIVKQLV